MKLSEDRVSHLAHLVCNGLYNEDLVDYDSDEAALKLIKKTITHYLSLDDKIDDAVRAKIATLKRGVFEGSHEWEVMYRKYYEEEAQKKHF